MSVSLKETGKDVSLYLHAELLPNIRHVTLYVSIPANLRNNDIFPNISVSESHRSVSVSLPEPFDYVSDTIKLPARINEASGRLLTVRRQAGEVKADNRREYSFRMRVDDADESLRLVKDPMDSFVPWTAADMGASTEICCNQCRQVILDHSSAKSKSTAEASRGWLWKDLPSGNWAEMMDFWHCHKPDPHEGADHDEIASTARLIEDQNSKVKGYGAANQVHASPGTVLVDVATFLVSDLDCKGLKKTSTGNKTEASLETGQEALWCEICSALMGVQDPIAKGWRLFKTSLSAHRSDGTETTWESHPTETVVAAQLLELIERESARRFVIHCGRGDGFLIWVFNPDLRYSNSSTDHGTTSYRGMKIFFQPVADVEEMLNPGPGRASPLSLEELKLPSRTFDSLSDALEKSHVMLPVSARMFREWKVGILHRFERSVRSARMSTDAPGSRHPANSYHDEEDLITWEHIEDTRDLPDHKYTPVARTAVEPPQNPSTGLNVQCEPRPFEIGIIGQTERKSPECEAVQVSSTITPPPIKVKAPGFGDITRTEDALMPDAGSETL